MINREETIELGTRRELCVDDYLIDTWAQDTEGKPCEGLSLDECHDIVGDELERIVSWDSGSGIGSLAGRPVRLRVVLSDAELYALKVT